MDILVLKIKIMEENVKITIEGEGLSLAKNTTLQKAGQIISFLGYGSDTSSVQTDRATGVGAPLLPTKRLLPKEFITNSNAKTYPQKITALAVCLKEQNDQDTFTPQELKLLFKKMGDEPKNFTRDLKSALELQYITCTDSTAELYELTDNGIDAYGEAFSATVSRKGTTSKKSSVSKGVREEVKSLELIGSMDGYLDFYKLPTKGDKILWLLEYADKNGVVSLTPPEVDFLSTRLRERIESGGFTALNERNIKKSFTKKMAEGFQIQKRGSDYLLSLGKEA
jgi:hypothetical protein